MFKLASSELKKMFMRPAVYVMLFTLAIVLVVTTMLYNPQKRTNPTTTFGGAGQTISMAFTNFTSSSSVDSKSTLDANLESAKDAIQEYSSHESYKTLLSTKLTDIAYTMCKTDPRDGTLAYDFNEYKWEVGKQTEENKQKVITDLNALRNIADSLYQICKNEINQNNIDFYITKVDFNEIKDYAFKLYLAIPTETDLLSITREALISHCNNILDNFQPTSAVTIINNCKAIEITYENTTEILEQYYNKISSTSENTILANIYNTITSFVAEHSDETSDKAKAEFNELTTQYKIASQIATNLLNDSFYYAKTSNLSDETINQYIGFENVNRYSANENLTLQNYLLDNKIFDGKYLTNLNFNASSGYENSAYDFTVYAMQILSIVLIMFALFFAVTILAGDFQNGSMKMIATRPLTRTQIVGGKTLATINFTLIFAVFCLVASFVVGYAMFGLGSEYSVITVFNATSVMVVPAWAMLLIYFVSLMLNIIFFIVLSNLFSVIFRSSILSMFLTFFVFAGWLVLNALFVNATWFIYTPFAYLDLFRFFGGATTTPGFLSIGATASQSVWIVFAIYLGMIVLLDIITKWIFQKRDIA